MEEFDLNAIWARSEEDATAYYQALEGQVVVLARQQSSSILQRIKRNAWIELFSGIILWAALFYWFIDSPLIGCLTLFGCILYAITGIGLYKMLVRIKLLNTMKVSESIAGYLKLFRKSYRRVKLMMYVLVPVGYVLGFFMGYLAAGGEVADIRHPWQLGIVILISIAFLSGFIWFTTRKYMYWMYGKHIDQLQAIYDNLTKGDPHD